jgi:hypothetical protein
MSKLQVRRRNFKLSSFNGNKYFLAQNFADDTIKASQQYAKDGVKQGEKLRDQAIELGKDKGYIYIDFNNDFSFFSYYNL